MNYMKLFSRFRDEILEEAALCVDDMLDGWPSQRIRELKDKKMNSFIADIKRAFGCRVGSIYSKEDLIDIADVAVTQHVQYPHNMDLEECVRIAVSAIYEEIK